MIVLVTDGESRAALAVTRSLGRKGYTVFVAQREKGSIAADSKYCKKAFLVPDPLHGGERYSKAIIEIVSREKVDVIFPITEQSVYSLNYVREQFGNQVILACAPYEPMEMVSNKYKLFQMAERLGIAIPATIFVPNSEDIEAITKQVSGYPVVVKPSASRIQEGDRFISTGVMYAANQDELSLLYETKAALQYPSLIQEMIIGEGTGLFTLFDYDHHLALFSHRRILEKPPSGGVSVISESVSLDNEMVESSQKLLSEVHWPGIAMVEFKRDIRDGRAKLMEINGRFWGSLQLAISSGVDFPGLFIDYHLGRKGTPLSTTYEVGHKMKWPFGILDHLIIRLKNGKRFNRFPIELPSYWQVTKELISFRGANTSLDVFDSDDYKPFINETMAYIRNIL